MRKCQIENCKEEAIWMWQPGLEWTCFVLPGWHYRGWGAVNICEEHKDFIRNNDEITVLVKNKALHLVRPKGNS